MDPFTAQALELQVTACEQPLQLVSKNHKIKTLGIIEEVEVSFNGKLVQHQYFHVELPEKNIVLFGLGITSVQPQTPASSELDVSPRIINKDPNSARS